MIISPDPACRCRLVVMLKEPHPGRVKTRLGRDIGMGPAAHWFRLQSAGLLRQIRDPRWQVVLAVSPDREGLSSRIWPADLARISQGRGNLGDRMRRLFWTLPPGPTCIIGADIPDISRRHVADAFGALGDHDAVFGPATDGGYWLVGLKRSTATPAGLFAGVRWSSPFALADSMASLPADQRIATITTLSDVDTGADLARHAASSGQNIPG